MANIAPLSLILALITIASSLPVQDDLSLEHTLLAEVEPQVELLPEEGATSLLREKRQGYRNRRPGGFGGAGRFQGGGFPGGGFQGGAYPGGGFSGGFQQPSFSSSAANAQAQAFNAGNFGASSAGAQSQGFGFGPGGFQGSAAQSISQSYKFPGLDISVSGANSFGVGPGGVTQGGGQSVSINGKPFTG